MDLQEHLATVLSDPVFDRTEVALALSGGPDSMALAGLLARMDCRVLAVTIDHDLREGSHDEAVMVGEWVTRWPNINHRVERRPRPATNTRLMEHARRDRYRILDACCRAAEISTLLTAHHRDDQAETVLFRLAKGSGLDGLAGMARETRLPSRTILRRPLLDVPKAALLAFCDANGIPYLRDPSNSDRRFARARLREALAGEGATAERLAATASRLGRAREALDHFAAETLRLATLPSAKPGVRILSRSAWMASPPEIRVRVIALLLAEIGGSTPLRLTRVGALADAVFNAQTLFRDTLHRCLVTCDPKRERIEVRREAN